MPVRIYFRGLILFKFPKDGEADAGKLVAELISEPLDRTIPKGARPGQDDHQAEIQLATGEDVRTLLSQPGAPAGGDLLGQNRTPDDVHRLLPRTLHHGARIEITVPGCVGGVQVADSFNDHVPDIASLAAMTNPRLLPGKPNDAYVRNTIVVDCGRIRANDVVTWDNGFPLGLTLRDVPSSPTAIKFMGVDFGGHAATECVVDIPEPATSVSIRSDAHPELSHVFRAVGGRNQLAPEDTLEIMVRNYEYQRDRPVPWGMDFQWLFARLGYGVVDLGNEFDAFANAPRDPGTAALLQQDRASMIRGRDGRPFPYIVDHGALTPLTRLQPGIVRPATDIKSRPLCVPGK